MLRRFYARVLRLWHLALAERATPGGIAASISLGVFVGCSPFLMLHGGIAIVAATVLRLNRLWAFVGTRVSFFLVLPWIVLAEIQTAHRLRTGEWAPLFSANVVAHANEWFFDWCLGWLPVGAALAAVFAAIAYVLARRREDRATRRTPVPAPPPTSESPR